MNLSKKNPPTLLLTFLICFPQFSESIYSNSLHKLSKTVRMTQNYAEFTLSMYFFAFAFGVLVWGILADVLGRRKPTLIALMVYAVGAFGCFYSTCFNQLLIFRLIQGFGASAGSIVIQTMIRDVFFGSKRNQMFSLMGAAASFSLSLGAFFVGLINQRFPVNFNLLLLTIASLLLLILSFFFLKETRQGEKTSLKKLSFLFVGILKKMSIDTHFLKYIFSIGICNGILFSYYGECSFIFIKVLKFSSFEYGAFGLLTGLSALIALFLSVQLHKNFKSAQINKIGALIIIIGALLLKVISILKLNFIENQWQWLLLPFFLLITGLWMVIPNSLSNVLLNYNKNLGISGSIAGLISYLTVSFVTGMMSFFHNGALSAMSNYFLFLSLLLCILNFIKKLDYSPKT